MMGKKHFWITFLLLAIGLVLVTAGCGDNDEPAPVEPTQAAETIEEPADVPEPAEVDEPEGEGQPTEADEAEEAQPVEEPPAPTFDNLHVPSPDWSDQIIYFLMTDRFADGDPSNNDQGAGEFDAQEFSKYNGGDLQGIIDNLDYIQGLGATAIWITPPVSNQWWDPVVEFGGYHGYWAEDFKAVDPHLGDLTTYQALSDELHSRGMYLIQDIVTNHTGNFFTYRSDSGLTRYDPADPAADVNFNPESVPVSKPSQPPFDLNDVTDPAQEEAAVYHWTPTIEDGGNESQRLTYQLSDLDDLNTENPLVREALRDSYGYWIENVGVDAFRIDTVKYVEHDFWNDFIHSTDPAAPGINAVAAETGRDDFLTFGETFEGSAPFDNTGDRFVASYLGSEEKPEIAAMLNFPMYFTINRVFAEGQPTSYMTYRLNTAIDPEIFPNPELNPNFIDNHDVPRFLSKGNLGGLKQALMFQMTVPGIPVIYYGTEQGFDQTRAAMFAGGWESGGVDNYNPDAELYQFIQEITALRKSDPLFTRGTLTTLADNDTGPGELAYRRDHEGETALVIFNTSDRPVLVTDMETGLPEGTVLTLVKGLVNQEDLVVGFDGTMTMELGPREAMILSVSDEVRTIEGGRATVEVASNYDDLLLSENFEVAGTISEPNARLKVIVNGNLANAFEATAGEDGQFTAEVPISLFPPGQADNTLTVYAPDLQVASEPVPFSTEVTSTNSRTQVFDFEGDDVGPLHTYTYPTDDTYGRQMDIHSVTASAFGTNLVVDVEMAEITDVWGPANGFDHTLFHIFIDLPGEEGQTALPKLNAQTPEGFDWDYLSFADGWGNRFFSAEGADEEAYGTAVTPAAAISTDKDTAIASFLFTSDAMGNPESLEGAQVYVTTWEWNGIDAKYQPLRPGGGQWAFGGGNELEGDPLIMDASDVVVVGQDKRIVANDPAGDDFGPYDPATAGGRYTPPALVGFGGQMDLRTVTLLPGEEALTIRIETSEMTDIFDAPNGFDHVRFHVYLDVPEQEGTTRIEILNSRTPDDFSWDYVAVVDGWNNLLYEAEGADETDYGNRLETVPGLVVDAENSAIELTIPASALGSPENMEAIQAYVTTWDYDPETNNLRELREEPDPQDFGGGDLGGDPFIYDDVWVGRPMVYNSPVPPTPQATVTFVATVPASTPADAELYITGPFNQWDAADPDYRFTQADDGTYVLVVSLDEGTAIEYRLTRGSFANAEVYDPEDRLANRELALQPGQFEETVELMVEGWWDQ